MALLSILFYETEVNSKSIIKKMHDIILIVFIFFQFRKNFNVNSYHQKLNQQ
jgi:hypothetical protein